jgi:hypothetical protein
MTKLSDMQLMLLTTACQREDGSLLPPPESLGEQAARIRKAVEALINKGLAAEKKGMAAVQSWRTDGDLNFGVVITNAGRAIIDPPVGADTPLHAGENDMVEYAGTAAEPRITKQSMLIDLLKREGGASLDEIVSATGWLPHSSRAALTGLRKKGHEIAKERIDGTTRYQIKVAA